MARAPGFLDVDERLQRLSDIGDQLEAFMGVIDFEKFRAELDAALRDGVRGGRPPFDPVMMVKSLVIQAKNDFSDDRAEFQINDRLSLMRFMGLGLGLTDKVPDAKAIWAFRERLTRGGVIEALFARFDRAIGYIPMSGQIVDANLVSAPR